MEGIVVRRVIPSDNSCLFNAVGFVMDHDKHKASELRQVIAATVASDPTKYSEAFLGKSNEEYCTWILDSEKWGGAIELSILADYYGREIAAYDIQTTRCDLYGQEKKYSERVMLIYDGLHYDALAMSPFEGAPEEFDQTIFAVQDGTIGRGDLLTLPTSLCVVECAKLERLWNMLKLQAMSTFKNTDDSNYGKQSHHVVPFYHSELL
ncbi:ubiquitin thioesterase otu1 [Quercus suber]|uniref:Ubiquitin thioesterase OTU n=1 Tax=Quercus suber TaxID=58331 RepID=A0AAW0IWA0_QUESU